jgi:hypothetical protein
MCSHVSGAAECTCDSASFIMMSTITFHSSDIKISGCCKWRIRSANISMSHILELPHILSLAHTCGIVMLSQTRSLWWAQLLGSKSIRAITRQYYTLHCCLPAQRTILLAADKQFTRDKNNCFMGLYKPLGHYSVLRLLSVEQYCSQSPWVRSQRSQILARPRAYRKFEVRRTEVIINTHQS